MTDQTARQDSTDGQAAAAGLSRRSLLRATGVGAAVVGGGSLLEACSSGIKGNGGGSSSSGGSSGTITIGWIHPLTGSPAGFGYPGNRGAQTGAAAPPVKKGDK